MGKLITTILLATTAILVAACSSPTATQETPSTATPAPTTTPTPDRPANTSASTTESCSPSYDGELAGFGSTLQIGDRAPDFTLPALGGCNYSLSDGFGETKQVLIFHRGLWCTICIGQLDQINNGRRRIEQAGGEIIAISPENADGPPAFTSNLAEKAARYPFPHLTTGHIDNDNDFFGAFTGHNTGNPRAVVIIDTDGTIIARFVSVQYYVDPNISVNQIIAALEEAG